MIKKKMIIMATISLLFTCLSVPTLDGKAETILTINYQEVSPLADSIELRYQFINSVLHKRQYNQYLQALGLENGLQQNKQALTGI